MSTNKVKQIRTRLSLSQRELAERAGTSQQQIQRIEAGRITTSLGLANSICTALGKPLDVVFPAAAKALKELRKEVADTRSLMDEALSKVSSSGIEADIFQWTLKVILTGHDEPLFFPISASEKRRLYSAVQGETDDPTVQFAVFDTGKHRIALNLSEVSFCQFLFDPPNLLAMGDEAEELDEEVGDDEQGVLVTLAGGGSSLKLSVDPDHPDDDDDMGQLEEIFYMMENGPSASDRYCILDADGEVAFIRAGSVALLRVAHGVLGDGEGEDENGRTNSPKSVFTIS